MNREVRKLIRFSAKAIVIILVIDFSVGKFMEHFYNKMQVGEKARANYLLLADTSELVIFGSSRALYHYHPGIIGDSLKLTVYNAGRSNQTILYHLAALKSILKRHTPRAVVLDVDEAEFVKIPTHYELLSTLLPYLRHDKDIAEIYTHANPGYSIWLWSRILPYNSSLFAILYRGFTKGIDKDIRGYLIKSGEHQAALQTINNCSIKDAQDPILKEAFHEFISVCKSHRIKTFLMVSPEYVRYSCAKAKFKAIGDAVTLEGMKIYNFSETETRSNFFADPAHLNSKGATEFSKKVASTIKGDLNH